MPPWQFWKCTTSPQYHTPIPPEEIFPFDLLRTFKILRIEYETPRNKMSFEALNLRISALHETTKHISILIERLQKLDFRPGSLPLPTGDDEEVEDDENVIAELSQEIREMLREDTETLESLDQEVRDFPGGKEGSHAQLLKDGLERMMQRARRDITDANTTFRDALETAKENLSSAQNLEKEITLSVLKTPDPTPTSPNPISPIFRPHTPKTPLNPELAASTDVTSALRRTHNLLLNEISRSQFATQILAESDAAVASLSEKYSRVDEMLVGSRNLLGGLLRSQKSDTWYLETAFKVLVATIVWLIFRRWVYGPAWWAIWVPLKLTYRVVFGVVGVAGSLGGSKVVSDVGVGGVTSILQSERPSLTLHNQATRAPKIEGQQAMTRRPPSIQVGGGGKGKPMPNRQPGQPSRQREQQTASSSMIEEVGKIIDESGDQSLMGDGNSEPSGSEEKAEGNQQQDSGASGNQEGEEEIIPNPNKRMFDTAVEDKKVVEEQQRKRDEL